MHVCSFSASKLVKLLQLPHYKSPARYISTFQLMFFNLLKIEIFKVLFLFKNGFKLNVVDYQWSKNNTVFS